MCTVQSGDCFIAKFRGIEAVLCLALETLALNCVILYMLGFGTFITYLNFSNHRMGEKKTHTVWKKELSYHKGKYSESSFRDVRLSPPTCRNRFMKKCTGWWEHTSNFHPCLISDKTRIPISVVCTKSDPVSLCNTVPSPQLFNVISKICVLGGFLFIKKKRKTQKKTKKGKREKCFSPC